MTIHQWRERNDEAAPEGAVAALLYAAAAPTEPGPQPGEESARAAFRARSHRRSPVHALTPAKAALATALAGGVLLTGGVAAAATGELPGPAQDTARHVLSHVGVTVPGSADDPSGQGDAAGQGKSPQGAGGSGQATDRQHPDAHGKGAGVSALAHATPPGTQHGKTVSSYASGGKSHAGQHGKAGEHSDHSEHSGHSGSSGGSDQSVEVRDHQPTTPTRPGDPTAHLPGHGVGGQGSGGGSGSGH